MAESTLSKLGPGAQLGAGIFVLALVGLGFYFTLYDDLDTQLTQELQRSSGLASELSQAKEARASYQADFGELNERQQRLKDLNKILPTESEAPAFLSSLQSVARGSRVSIDSYKPENEVEEDFFARIPISIAISGQYHQIAKFFYGVSQLERVINIESISLDIAKENNGESGERKVVATAVATAFRSLIAEVPAAAEGTTQP